ncbi:MAG: pilin [Desulfurella sp.]|uniref:pilin n=1 Tax=Desulfurella sp. TaxID=1962857 RepID=UPI003D0ECD75
MKYKTILILLSILSLTNIAFATKVEFPPCLTIPGIKCSGNISSPSGLVKQIYQFSLGIGGIIAVGVIVYAGILRIFSSGNPKKIQESNSYITGAIFGLLLLFGAAILFNTINPRISNMQLSGFKIQVPIQQNKNINETQRNIAAECNVKLYQCLITIQRMPPDEYNNLKYHDNLRKNCYVSYEISCSPDMHFIQYKVDYTILSGNNQPVSTGRNCFPGDSSVAVALPSSIDVSCP